jgi:hypothetical protein
VDPPVDVDTASPVRAEKNVGKFVIAEALMIGVAPRAEIT